MDRKWILDHKNNIEEYVVSGNILIPAYCIHQTKTLDMLSEKDRIFNNKEDAYFEMTLHRLEKGYTKLKNLKRSPYYNMYIEKLQERAPEYLI